MNVAQPFAVTLTATTSIAPLGTAAFHAGSPEEREEHDVGEGGEEDGLVKRCLMK